MASLRVVAPVSLLLVAACTPPPESAPKPTTAVDNVAVSVGETSNTRVIDYTVRSEKFVSNATIDGRLEQDWAVMPEVYKRFGLPVDGINPATHAITTGQVHVRRSLNNVPLSMYLECGRATLGPNADVYDINLRVETAIGGADGAVVVHSSLAAAGSGVGNGGSQVRCSSTGELERRIAVKLAELVPKK